MQITIIDTISESRVIIKCAYCKGSGTQPGYSTACSVCDGRGVLMLEINGEFPLVLCMYCKGSGIKPGYYVPCPQCNGSGAQPIVGKSRIVK